MVGKIKHIASSVARNVRNIPGWSTNRRIVVIESDDWGSIRIPSRDVYERFHEFGFNVRQSRYNRFDALESNSDLEKLFEVLQRYKDCNGRPAQVTANTIVCNPDFQKIASSGFAEYSYEHFTSTLKRYPNHNRVFDLYREGMEGGIFRPQFHGREHLNVARWMRSLQSADRAVRFAFENGTTYSGADDYSFMEALDMDHPSDIDGLRQIVADGLGIFRDTFGYESRSFIAPCYTWDTGVEEVLRKGGVRYLQGSRCQLIPNGAFGDYRKKYHSLGESNDNELIYMVRNCAFEPTLFRKSDWVDYTLSNIRDAFRWNKPAVIAAHRVNFVGFIDPVNRDNNLKLLNRLLAAIVTRWPSVEFMASDELGDLVLAAKQ